MTPRVHAYLARALIVPCVVALAVALQFIMTGGGGPARAAVLAGAGLAAEAGPGTPAPPTPSPPTLPDFLKPPPAPAPESGLARRAVLAAESVADTRTELAVAVLDRVTGELALGRRGTEPFLTASLSKLVVAVDILDRRRLEGIVVTEADLDLLRRALGPSDDSAMNALWSRFDGPGAAGRVSARLGLIGTTGPRDPSQWGEMVVPAGDTVRIWEYVLDSQPAADRDLLVSALAAAPATARDGFDQAFGLLSPAVRGDGRGAVAKQGWMCCFSGEFYLHSAGALGADQRYLVALLTRIPRSEGWEAARRQLDSIAGITTKVLG